MGVSFFDRKILQKIFSRNCRRGAQNTHKIAQFSRPVFANTYNVSLQQGSLEFMTECTTIEYPFELFDPQKNKSEIGYGSHFPYTVVNPVKDDSF